MFTHNAHETFALGQSLGARSLAFVDRPVFVFEGLARRTHLVGIAPPLIAVAAAAAAVAVETEVETEVDIVVVGQKILCHLDNPH